jgi:adenosylcobyric acid synthase
MHAARTIMVQGTASSVGKSLLATALCRTFSDDGLRARPFKAQNMSNNSYVTPDGREIGRAQAVQAAACGVEPSSDMNPVLLKPEADSRCQVVVDGRAVRSMPAREYYRYRTELWPRVTAALDRLRAECDVVVIEGAGSPAEVNLRQGDISNMAVALYAGSPVLLAGDIDRGGVFASLLGTLELLAKEERAQVKGLVINRFRGDRALLDPLPRMIAERTGVPVVGVVPHIPDVRLADEDSAWLTAGPASRGVEPRIKVAAIRLPRVSNFGDMDPLARAGAEVVWADRPEHLRGAHLIVVPGTKTTIPDLRWMNQRGISQAIREAANQGCGVIGICGGYQMLGAELDDPGGADSGRPDSEPGIGLLSSRTVFQQEKSTVRVRFEIATSRGLLAGGAAAGGEGYEVHTGLTRSAEAPALTARTGGNGRTGEARADGAVSADGWVFGTYVHGFLDSPEVTGRVLANIARRHRLPAPSVQAFSLDAEIGRVAEAVRGAVDMPVVYGMLGMNGRG